MSIRSVVRLALVLVFLPLLFGCDSITGSSNIDYRVTGSATRVSLTYETADGTAQISSTTLPWSFSRKAKTGDFLYVSAQIIEGDGSVTAAIYKGSSVFKTTTSFGFASIATANGSLD